MKLFLKLKDAFFDLLFPSDIYCICCGKPIYQQPYALCKDCLETIKWVRVPICSKCGKPLATNSIIDQCHDCVDKTFSFDKGFSCMLYNDFTKSMIYDFKFNNKGYYAKFFAELIFEKIKNEGISFEYILPVPLHPKKEKERGYNQSHLIASHLSTLMSIPTLSNVLIRIRYTSAQNQLSLAERKHNLKDAFDITDASALYHKQILLIDDIYTTGNTLNACSKELMRHKVSKVYVATVAIGADY